MTALQHYDGLLKVGGGERDQKLLGEGQSGVEELRSSQSGCTRQKVLVRQRGGLMCLLV